MSNDVEFLNDDIDLSGPKKKLVTPFDDNPSWSVRFILKTGLVKSRSIAAGIVIGTSIFFLSLSVVVSISVVLSPTSDYIKNKFPVVPVSDQSTNGAQNIR